MATPVLVSRIQNRRGTQAQFDALYPPGYTGVGGYNDSGTYDPKKDSSLIPINVLSGDGSKITMKVSTASIPSNKNVFVGSTITIDGAVPSNYDSTYVISEVINGSTLQPPEPGITIIKSNSTTTGTVTSPGKFYIPFVKANFPEILQPGEIALCTDTGNVYIGNLNGEYVRFAINISGVSFMPLTVELEPNNTPTVISELSYDPVNFFTLFYDLTDFPADLPPPDTTAGEPGSMFSRNGQMNITAIMSPITPPMPSVSPVNLVDTFNEINLTPAYDISFSAQYDNTASPSKIQILYQHNFPPDKKLVFSTATIKWS